MDSQLLFAFMSIGVMAISPILVGSFRSLNTKEEVESISKKDAQMFPVYGSATLFGLYLVFRFLSKEYVNLILTIYFSFFGTFSLASLIHPIISPVLFLIRPKGENYEIDFSHGKNVIFNQKFDWAYFVAVAISAVLSIFYAITKNWIANNLFGEAFATIAIELLHLDSFLTGIILLSGLFFYDIFWVFGTEVMVSVAKSFDGPIKVVFPKNLFAETLQFTMLGLGDIVIPGVFIALALRFDRSLSPNKENYPKPYFTACFIAYVLGLTTTIVVMQTFQAAQPALLYLSPACILSVVLTAAFRGELKKLMEFKSEDPKAKEAQEAKKE